MQLLHETSRALRIFAQYWDVILPLQLDVTNKTAVKLIVEQAFSHFGRSDEVVNNAGHELFDLIEEGSEAEVRAQIDTDFIIAFWVTQAILPYLRKQGNGDVIQVSSIGGLSAFIGVGLYHESKWVLEAFHSHWLKR